MIYIEDYLKDKYYYCRNESKIYIFKIVFCLFNLLFLLVFGFKVVCYWVDFRFVFRFLVL